jgi:hypothetical protein
MPANKAFLLSGGIQAANVIKPHTEGDTSLF